VLARPVLDEAFRRQQGEDPWRVEIKRGGAVSVATFPFNPLDAVGWHGDLSPLRLAMADIRPVMSHRYHLPPSAHATFAAERFVVCSFVPRPFESDPGALKVPFFHNNDDYDEVIFYHGGKFFSRDDIAPGMIDECRKRFGQETGVRFDVASADHLPETDGSVDAVTAMGLLEYLNDEDAALHEFARILKPNGLAVLTYPHHASPSRAWNRLTHQIAKPFLAVLRRGKPAGGVKHREYRLKPTLAQIHHAGFDVKDVVFYNMKLGFRPLDALFPKATVWIASRLERFCRTPILRRIGTGFIVLAVKR